MRKLFLPLFLKKGNSYKDENLQVGPVYSEYTKLLGAQSKDLLYSVLGVLSSSYSNGLFEGSKWSKGHIS